MEMIERQIAYNRSPRKGGVQYIVIHDTGNRSAGANARSHYNYFNGGDRQSSADFFVDDKEVWKVNDYTKYYTWHCGDGGGKYGVTNANSIGVELCINSDGDYNKTFDNAVELTKQLMAKLDIPPDRVVRHYDASRKNCPQSMNNGNWALWEVFREGLEKEVLHLPKTVYSLNDVHVQVIDPWAFKLAVADKGKNSIGAQNYANAGYFAQGANNATIPVGNLVVDGKGITDAKSQADWLNTARHKLTTIVVHHDDTVACLKVDDMTAVKDVRCAISGIPIIYNGYKVPMADIKAEGYFGNECYDTWHGFLGIRDGRLVYVAAKVEFELMVYLLEVLGIKFGIKLDGGGSFILHNGDFVKKTSENRRIHNVLMW